MKFNYKTTIHEIGKAFDAPEGYCRIDSTPVVVRDQPGLVVLWAGCSTPPTIVSAVNRLCLLARPSEYQTDSERAAYLADIFGAIDKLGELLDLNGLRQSS